jgi:hypothetical protein
LVEAEPAKSTCCWGTWWNSQTNKVPVPQIVLWLASVYIVCDKRQTPPNLASLWDQPLAISRHWCC